MVATKRSGGAADPSRTVASWLGKFEAALKKKSYAAAANLFEKECYWRDLVSFTWNITTQEGRAAVLQAFKATMPAAVPGAWTLEGDATETDGVVEGWIRFETKAARGKGYVRLRKGKCWTLLTSMEELKGFEETNGSHGTRPVGVDHGASRGRPNWLDRKECEEDELGFKRQPYCVIIGGGQGGIALAARLKRLEVPTIVIERNKRPGDSWRKRYHSLCLHDPVWYDHFPYIPFPDHWPVFSPKDKIGDWMEMYTKVMELNYWSSTECKGAKYDARRREWTVVVQRGGKRITLRPRQLVLATGMSGVANVPSFPGMRDFKGTMCHSSRHSGGAPWRGKKAVVVGSNNSGHDICADLWEQGADVTMIQRTSTHIARSETLMDLALGGLYSEEAVRNGITTNMADMIFASVPYRIMHKFHIPVYEEMARRDAKLYRGLRKAGFMLDFGEDGSGLFMKYLRRGSGYYIDVGASQLIVDGKIKLQSDTTVERFKRNSVVLTNGKELRADLVVLATGYSSMNGWAERLISREVANRVGKCWGLGSDTGKDPGPWEGELRNMWKPTNQPALWFHGGNLHQSRHYSQFLSLQIKARLEGLKTPVYGLSKVHHLG